MSENINQLMQQVAEGNENAFRDLARHVSPRALALATRLLNGDVSAAEDVLQEVLIKVWKHAPKWEAKGSAAGYVQRLVYTASIDRIRKVKPTSELVDDIAQDAMPNAQQQLEVKQQNQALYQLLNKLPERQRSAMVLTYLQEMPQKDVATTLGTSVKAVESLLIRAKRTLQQAAPKVGINV